MPKRYGQGAQTIEGLERAWFYPSERTMVGIDDTQRDNADELHRTPTQRYWVKQVGDRYIKITDAEADRLMNGAPPAPTKRLPKRRRPTRGIGISDDLYERLLDRAERERRSAADLLEDVLTSFLDH